MTIKIKDSVSLLGVLDPLGVLGPGEVYIACQKEEAKQVLAGRVMVTRNPCNKPSDIRILKAVDYPILTPLTNVVVFSRNSPSPDFAEMSNGDLDGDVYFVCWDKDIMDHITE